MLILIVRTGQIEIIGIKGNINNTYLENIPINYLNAKHTIIIPDPENNATHDEFLDDDDEWIIIKDGEDNATAREEFRQKFFFIQLPIDYKGIFSPVNYTIQIQFLSIKGISINNINAEFPVDVNHLHGYHLVSRVTTDGFAIKLPEIRAMMNGTGGGSSVVVAKINRIHTGYIDSNHYSTHIKTLYNVIMAHL